MTARIAIHAAGRLVQGNERQLELIARGLLRRGHELYVSAQPATDTWKLLADTGASMTAARPRGMADVVSALRFRRWLAGTQPDAILLSSWRRMWTAARAARAAGVPRIVQRIGMTHPVPHGLRGIHYRHALQLVDIIYANSEDVKASLLRDVPSLDPDRIRVQVNALPPLHAAPVPIREELRIAPGRPLVVAVGGLSRRKGFDLLIRAMVDVPDAHLLICGEGAERDALVAQAAALGVADRTHLAGQRSDVPGILAAADMFVSSSRADSLSVAMLEAMRARLPVVATEVAGARQALGDAGERLAGWIVPTDDARALAAAINEVLSALHHEETRRRATEARRRVEQRYTVESMVDGVESMLLG